MQSFRDSDNSRVRKATDLISLSESATCHTVQWYLSFCSVRVAFTRYAIKAIDLRENTRISATQSQVSTDGSSIPVQLMPLVQHLERRLLSHLNLTDMPIEPYGTPFQMLVWSYLRTIPRGATQTYGQVAKAIGKAGAVRAVANACACNSLALAIPCHRVVRSDGTLGGYRWGVELKHRLLELEKAPSDLCKPTEELSNFFSK